MAVTPDLADLYAWKKEKKDAGKLDTTPQELRGWQQEGAQTVPHQNIPHWQNLLAGVTHGPINLANLVLQGIQEPAHALAGRPIDKAVIPQIPHSPHSLLYDVGDIGSSILPFARAARGVEAAGTGAMRLADLARRVPVGTLERKLARLPLMRPAGKVLTSTGAGALVGAGTADPNQRTLGSIVGGLGGGVGEAVGQGLGYAFRRLRDAPAVSKLRDIAAKGLNLVEAPAHRLVKAIAQAYIAARNKTAPLYEKIFGELRNRNAGMTENDFPNYKEVRNRIINENMKMPYEAVPIKKLLRMEASTDATPPSDLMLMYQRWKPLIEQLGGEKFPEEPSNKLANPNYIHRLQSYLRSMGRPEARGLGRALRKDLVNFLRKEGLDNEYERATDQFRKDVAPFLRSETVKKHIIPKIDSEIDRLDQAPENFDPEGRYRRAFKGIDTSGGEALSNIGKGLVPSATDQGMEKLNYLENILGHLPDNAAMTHARDNIFANTLRAHPHTEEMVPNMNLVINRYEKLTPAQRNKLFAPHENKLLNTLVEIKQKKPKTHKLTQLGERLLAGTIGHHLAGWPGAFAGYAGGPNIADLVHEFTHELTTSDPEVLIRRIRNLTPPRRSRVLAPLAAAMMRNYFAGG